MSVSKWLGYDIAGSGITSIAEENGTAQESWDIEHGVSANVTLRVVPHTKRHLLARLLLEGNVAWPYPLDDDAGSGTGDPNTGLVCTSAQIVTEKSKAVNPTGDSTLELNQYADALLHLKYSPSKYEVHAGGSGSGSGFHEESYVINTYSEEFIEKIQYQRLDYKQYKWQSDNKELKENEAPPRIIPGGTFRRTFYRLPPACPLITKLTGPTADQARIGKTNSSAFTSSLAGIPFLAEELLLKPAKVTSTNDFRGQPAVNLTLDWEYKSGGWNKFFRPRQAPGATDLFDTIYRKKDSSDSPSDQVFIYRPTNMTMYLFNG